MCGIAGFLGGKGVVGGLSDAVAAMAGRLVHRGPDDSGTWSDDSVPVALAHRRLAILDTSSAGHQPMYYRGLTIAFNGEIYNYRELRNELETRGFEFRGGSDTEVLLSLVFEYGVEVALSKCRGMFAFALWDSRNNMLYLARDRFGEKPLYIADFKTSLVFGSELQALSQHPSWRGKISRESVRLFFQFNCVPQPRSIFEDVGQVRPGHYICAKMVNGHIQAREYCYWNAESRWRSALDNTLSEDSAECVRAVRRCAEQVVSNQMVSDVPLGAFLSGGVDSSFVVALMCATTSRRVQTFTIGFADSEFDESAHARKIAKILGTDHTEVMFEANDARDLIPDLPYKYGEPFADSSQLPSLLVAQATRRRVTVALTGDGSDEFYGGYSRYLSILRRWQQVSKRPLSLRRAAWRLARSTPDWAFELVSGLFAHRWAIARGRGSASRVAASLVLDIGERFEDFYTDQVCFWHPTSAIVVGAQNSATNDPPTVNSSVGSEGLLRWMMFRDSQAYLNDDILTKVDRAAMSYSLETRAPFLDHELCELAWRIPTSTHFKDGAGKWIIRTILSEYVPQTLIDRPKMGFAVPIGSWLRKELREWAEDLLGEKKIRSGGWLDPSVVNSRWRYHLRGDDRYALSIWSVLMFQAWLEAVPTMFRQ